MFQSPIVVSFVLLLSAAAAIAEPREQVVSVDANENIYIDNIPTEDLSALKKERGPLFARIDARVPVRGMCRVLMAANARQIFLGQPKTLGKRVSIQLGQHMDVIGSLPIAARSVGSSWSSEPDSVIISVDFDGTLSWNRSSIINLATLDERFDELAVQQPQAHIYIQPDMLSKTSWTEDVAISAKDNGFSKITIACRTSK